MTEAGHTGESSGRPSRRGLAIASLVLGILSVPTLGLLGIGAVVGLILGVVALVKAHKHPDEYAGAGMAIAGIALCALAVLMIPLVAAVAVPSLLRARASANEASAIGSLMAINSAQATYAATCGSGFYAPSLADLATPAPGSTFGGFVGPDLGTDPVVRSEYTIRLVPGPPEVDAPASCNGVGPGRVVSSYFVSAEPVAGDGRYLATNQDGTVYGSPTSVPVTQRGAPPGATPVR